MESGLSKSCKVKPDYCKKKNCDDKKYLKNMMKSESEILECMQKFLCHFLKDLKDVEPPEKRAKIAKEVICAYACKEQAIADIVKAITCKEKIDKCKKVKHHQDCNDKCDSVENYLFIIVFLLIICRMKCINSSCTQCC